MVSFVLDQTIDVNPIVGVLPDEDKFDRNFFGLHYKLSLWVDPTHRLGFERSFEAIIDAGRSRDLLSAHFISKIHTTSKISK